METKLYKDNLDLYSIFLQRFILVIRLLLSVRCSSYIDFMFFINFTKSSIKRQF